MRGVVDIFISKEKLAFFWFSAACVCLALTAWYVYDVAITSRGSMLYVPIEGSHVYVDRTMQDLDLDELVDYHTRLALETFLNRGPRGPLTMERLPFLFAGKGMEQVRKEIQDTKYDFHSRQMHQIMEVGQVRVQHFPNGDAETVTQGQIIRVSLDPASKEVVNQSFSVTARLNWERNQNLRDSRRFPFVCNNIEYSLSPYSSSE